MNAHMILCSLVACVLIGAPVGAQERDPETALPDNARILFLHHSTGECIWNGGVPQWFEDYNAAHETSYAIREQYFPKEAPYGWENFPYDYWNIWVRHAGPRSYREEPTLEMLTPRYDIIVFKHCFPVSNIEPDTGRGDVASPDKRLENYRLQYAALKAKLHEFPDTRFLVWTGAAQVATDVDEASARRARTFFQWVRETWDEPGDNIFVWDFYTLETGGSLYLRPEFASGDAHPNESFSARVAPLFCQRVVDVIQGRGDTASITGGEMPALARSDEPGVPEPAPGRTPPPTAVAPPVAGDADWVFDDAEDASRLKARWEQAAGYVQDGDQHAIRIDFSGGQEEDWGEYGLHRLVWTRPPEQNFDVSGYRYLAFRMKCNQELPLVLTMVTLPEPRGDRYQPHFGFSAYLDAQPDDWQQVVIDLTKLELAAEGEEAYAAAGRPNRPQSLTALKFAVNERHEDAEFLIDDIVFYRQLPAGVRPPE